MLTTTISSGAANSTAIEIAPNLPRGLGVFVPSAWTSATISFEVSNDGSTWYPLRGSDGSLIGISGIQTAAAGLYAAPAEIWVMGRWKYMRLVSSVNQGADRELQVYFVA